MCTLSIIPITDGRRHVGLRVVINRDESASRERAVAPRWHDVPGTRAVWPIDPVGGGTWVAGSERGVVFALLNRNMQPGPDLPSGLVSRGTIIPAIAHATGVQHGVALLRAMNTSQFAPFRLVIAAVEDGVAVASVCSWDRRVLAMQDAGVPLCLASSGLGDCVAQARLPLFESMVRGHATPEAQDVFHVHQWPHKPEASVMMRRPGYRTVSVTTLEVADGSVRAEYRDIL